MTRGSTPTAPVGGPGKQVGGQVARPMVAVPCGTEMAAAVILVLPQLMLDVGSGAGKQTTTTTDQKTARAVQGVGAALAAPSVMVLLMGGTSPGPQRSRVLSMFVLAIGSGAAVGLLTGGVLTQTQGTAAFGAAFEAAGKVVALRRLADAEEIAGAVTFLASQAASYVNGTTLGAMGGMPALG